MQTNKQANQNVVKNIIDELFSCDKKPEIFPNRNVISESQIRSKFHIRIQYRLTGFAAM